MESTKPTNQATDRNTAVFGGLMAILHIGTSLIYAFCITNITSYINTNSVIVTICLAFLTIAGFGLVFSYLKRFNWSGIGFAFLITAICIEIYPLVNAFWTKVAIQKNPISNTFKGTNNGTVNFTVFLSNLQIPLGANYANTITMSIKCGLSILVAFSSILGRAGPLECLIVSLFGAMGFEFNRQIISNLAQDSFGTFSIFTFGGFMGLALGLILYFRERGNQKTATQRHPKYSSNDTSAPVALFGALIIFLFFPLLAFDLDTFHGVNRFNYFTGPFYIVIAMGASVVGAVIVSTIYNGQLIVRDLLHAPIAGGIIAGSASFFITAPVYALVVGFAGGAVQAFLQNIFQKGYTGGVVSTISWMLFGIQGLLGGAFATGYREILNHNSNNISFTANSIDFNAGYQMLICVISAGLGLATGIIAGLFVLLVNRQNRDGHFEDKEYWINDCGISNYIKEQSEGLELVIGAAPPAKPVPQPQPAKKESEVDQGEIFFEVEENEEPKNNFAYL